MTEVQDESVDVEAVVEEAKESFSLIDSIKNRPMRSVKLVLGYDEVNSEKLARMEGALGQLRNLIEQGERNASAIDEFKKSAASVKRRLKKANAEEAGPLQEELEGLEMQIEQCAILKRELAPLQAQVDEMDKKTEEIREQVNKESISVELRALPYAIARGSARRARKFLGITQKGIPEELQEEFEERQLLELAYDQVVRFRYNKEDRSGTKLTVEEIEAIRDYMPLSQSGKFFKAVNDLQFANAISESTITQADF